MFCSISGTAPQEPVVSKLSGHLFEKRLIEKYIADHGKCPVTGAPMSADDLLAVSADTVPAPRPIAATSIPGMLALFQNEWDALMLETHTLKKQNNTLRQELSHALYQHDAACRVIARLMKENQGLKSELAIAEARPSQPVANGPAAPAAANGGKRAAGTAEEGPDSKRLKGGIPPEVTAKLNECSLGLSKGRKKRQISSTLAKAEDIQGYTQVASHPLHKTTAQGILSCDISAKEPEKLVTGGNDGNAVVFNKDSGKILATLAGHSKKVTTVKFLADDAVLSCSADKTARLWAPNHEGGYECRHTLSNHSAEVTSAGLHPTGEYFVTASADKSWAFYDVATGSCLTQVSDVGVNGGYSCASFHPDGLILGTGTTDSLVRIWDVNSQQNLATFEGHTGAVTSISFSENGYYLATAASDGVKLWDLRKLKNFRSVAPYEGGSATACVEFDYSGSYLAVGGLDVRVYHLSKQDMTVVKTFPDHSGKGVKVIKFGPDAKYLTVGSSDRNLRIFGPPAVEEGAQGAGVGES